MIYSNIRTHYLTSNSNDRLVRYDVIEIDEDNYLVKVIDDEQKELTPSCSLIEVFKLSFTRGTYKSDESIGSNNMFRQDITPSFEGYILQKCQKHRDSLD